MNLRSHASKLHFRPATDADRAGIITLIDEVYREYGERMCLDGFDSDLNDIEGNYPDDHFMVVEDGVRILGTIALSLCPEEPKLVWLKRMYLASELRGEGWAQRMVEWVFDQTRDAGRARVQLWSDVRFDRAHAFYKKIGFVDTGEQRTMHNSHEPFTEYFFFRDLSAQ